MRIAGRQRAIVLIDGEHHPAAVGDALSDLAVDRDIVSVVFCGGSEKIAPSVLADPEMHYGYPLVQGDDAVDALLSALSDTRADVVIDLSDEPVMPADEKLRMAAIANSAGLTYEGPGMTVDPMPLAEIDFEGPIVSVIGTGKRTGKTAVCGHLAGLIKQQGGSPAIVSMGRGGPAVPTVASPSIELSELVDMARRGIHAASDYLEDAVLAGVPTVGCRRVGGGLNGDSAVTNFAAGAEVAAAIEGIDSLLLEGSGATIPPLRADCTVCVAGPAEQVSRLGGPLRIAFADLVLVPADDPLAYESARRFARGAVTAFRMVPTPVDRPPEDARVAVFTTNATTVEGVSPQIVSTNLADRMALEQDLLAAETAGCTHYLTELKAAAIDGVAEFALARGAALSFIRNRPVGVETDLDRLLLNVWQGAPV